MIHSHVCQTRHLEDSPYPHTSASFSFICTLYTTVWMNHRLFKNLESFFKTFVLNPLMTYRIQKKYRLKSGILILTSSSEGCYPVSPADGFWGLTIPGWSPLNVTLSSWSFVGWQELRFSESPKLCWWYMFLLFDLWNILSKNLALWIAAG